MSKSIVDKITEAFRSQAPFWACELMPGQVVLAGVDRKRSRVEGKRAVDLPAGAVAGSLLEANIRDADAVRAAIREAFASAAFKNTEIGLVIPDDATRIAFVAAENLPKDTAEQQTFVRWKLKKSVPFDVETAQCAVKVLEPGHVLVALSPRSIIQEYEGLMDGLDIHPGFVLPSTLAVLNLFRAPSEDSLVVKVAPGSVTTSVFQNRVMKFYRRVAASPLYDAVYPTLLYYQDKLGGQELRQVFVCGQNRAGLPASVSHEGSFHSEEEGALFTAGRGDGSVDLTELTELQNKLGVPVRRLGPPDVADIYKPALGAVHFAWQNLT